MAQVRRPGEALVTFVPCSSGRYTPPGRQHWLLARCRLSDGQIVFWPNDIEKAKTYFKALTGPYMDNISEEMVDVWATEVHANRAWLEALGMNPRDVGPAEFPEFDGADCVEMLVHDEAPAMRGDTALHKTFRSE